MNSVQLVGRFTRDPEIKYADSGTSIARFSLAVDRAYKREGGETADFVSCIAFGKTAEFIEKYFHKSQRMGVNGRIQTGSYTNRDGVKVYTTDVVAEHVEFVDSKAADGNSSAGGGKAGNTDSDGFMDIPDDIDEEVPF